MICQGMLGNGVWIGIRVVIIVKVPKKIRGVLLMALAVFCGAVVGTATIATVGLRIVTAANHTLTTGFVWLLAFSLPKAYIFVSLCKQKKQGMVSKKFKNKISKVARGRATKEILFLNFFGENTICKALLKCHAITIKK